jgi:D-glycero-beta-D-manno-heptose-7-phosphate kinase
MNKKILVIGDIILDHFAFGRVNRLNPESPSPLMNIEYEEYKLGWAANVAANIASLWVGVVLCGRSSGDSGSLQIRELALENSVELREIASKQKTVLKRRYIELTYRQQLLRTDWEDISPITPAEIASIKDLISELKPAVIVISDYKKGSICKEIAEIALSSGAKVLVDSKLNDLSHFSWAYIIKPNFKEFTASMGLQVSNTDAVIEEYGPLFVKKYQCNLVVTRSEKGASLVTLLGGQSHFKPEAKEVFDVTGAGDTFLAALAVGIAEWMSLEDSIILANTASGIAVSRLWTQIVTRVEVNELSKTSGWSS